MRCSDWEFKKEDEGGAGRGYFGRFGFTLDVAPSLQDHTIF